MPKGATGWRRGIERLLVQMEVDVAGSQFTKQPDQITERSAQTAGRPRSHEFELAHGQHPDNRGGYLAPMDSASYMIGHVWNEIGGEVADFSAGDWPSETDRMHASGTNLDDLRLGPFAWHVSPPEFIWQTTESLKAGWRSSGEPALGQIWYGPWSSHAAPDFRAFDQVAATHEAELKTWSAFSPM
jgi:hypothetical protein